MRSAAGRCRDALVGIKRLIRRPGNGWVDVTTRRMVRPPPVVCRVCRAPYNVTANVCAHTRTGGAALGTHIPYTSPSSV